MKIITIETLKAFLDELNKKYGTEFYSKAESDGRYQPKGSYVEKPYFDEILGSWNDELNEKANTSDVDTKLGKEDVYDSNMLKLPNGAKIGVE